MPVVFVHGNPETSAIWEGLITALKRDDVITLSPPGFGAPVPEGWMATRAEYIAWLTGELAAIEGPIDLVGHDFGGGHVLGFLLQNPDVVQSWCVDVIGIMHPDYIWHNYGQVWQTPVKGEESIAGMVSATEGMMANVDATMGECILKLYRDSAQPALANAGKAIERLQAKPGMCINAEKDDLVGSDQMAQEMADRAGARVVHLSGVGHWWMKEDPTRGAATLEAFWASL